MSYRDLSFVLLGAALALIVVQWNAIRRDEAGTDMRFEVYNSSGADLSFVAGNSKVGTEVVRIESSHPSAGQYVWPWEVANEDGIYTLSLECAGRTLVMGFERSQLDVRGGRITYHPNGDVSVYFGLAAYAPDLGRLHDVPADHGTDTPNR